ncbi:MAG: cell envelope integrity protein TolA [Coxiellaceae bacterium]|nr:cell envelope integrity protein TolA [Coxiellaceae bacterium]
MVAKAFKKIPAEYRWPLIVAVVLHLILIISMTIEIKGTSYKQLQMTSKSPVKVVQAHAISVQQVNKQVKRVDDIKQAKLKAKRAAAAKKRAIALAKAKAIAKAKAQAQARVRAKAKAKALALAKAKAAAKAAAQAKAKAVAAKAAAKAKAIQVAKQRAALKAQQQKLQQALMQQQLQADQSSIKRAQAQAQARATALAVDKYKTQILQAISQRWLVPSGVSKKLSCELMVRLGPGGVVLNVKTVRSSGNSALDRSATTAVYKASPLPVPKDPALFDKFRELSLTVRPESVVDSEQG